MFSQNKEEAKLDWMYKGANSLVDREDYLLGRTIDKTLEQLNTEEKQKASNQLPAPKNHVEHECIPPSIRDYNKISLADQVDLAAKLQEDPLVAIRKREEETRKQFLQNPIQLKKLQKALKSQQNKKESKKKKKKRKHSKDIDAKLIEKLNQLKSNPLGLDIEIPNKNAERDGGVDNLLIHKFNKLKNKLTKNDIKAILEGKETSSDEDASSDEESRNRSKVHKNKHRNLSSGSEEDKDSEYERKRRQKQNKNRYDTVSYKPKRYEDDDRGWDSRRRQDNRDYKTKYDNYKNRDDKHRSSYSKKHHRNSDSSNESDTDKSKSRNAWGLTTHDGKKLELSKRNIKQTEKVKEIKQSSTSVNKNKTKLTEEEKEKRRREMMENAEWRDKEREKNVKKYREEDSRESKQLDFDPDFIHNQLLKATSSASVESRIKSNVNNIQRSSGHMNKHFSRRN